MKIVRNARFFLTLIWVLWCGITFSQASDLKYESLPDDPIHARIYTLPNGLRVYMSVNKSEPRIQTCIAVRAGSKNDPADATGLAHYLEHMLFKGTDRYGSLDYSQEQPLLEKIEALYEKYRQTRDEEERKKIYAEIDATSGEAAKYAIANEYDKMVSAIGATGTNAYTSFEQTVYVNEIPSNQLGNWLKIEAERFRKPVFRIFHTELEAVYEEKNISLDRDGSRVFENLFSGLFHNHNYGLQTTIGTVEHLKNPSIRKIREYYERNYVPNNMAICIAGDFDPDEAISQIYANFSTFQPKPVEPYAFPPETEVTAPVIRTVSGPDAEFVQFAYRFPGANSRDALVLEIIDKLLSNSTAGLLDLNLNQKQKVLGSQSFTYVLKDYSVHFFSGRPREGQTLEEVSGLIMEQIGKVKKGEFEEDMIGAVINQLEFSEMESFEDNSPRADAFVDAFTLWLPWDEYMSKLKRMRTITKDEIMRVANQYYKDNYVMVYKKNGPRDNVVKVTKPPITPVEVNRTQQSAFANEMIHSAAKPIQPRFLDFEKDITRSTAKSNIPFYYIQNGENQRFSLYYLLDMGKMHDKRLELAVRYLPFLGTETISAEELKTRFYKLGCSFDVSAGGDQVYVSLRGLAKNFRPAMELFEEFLANVKPDQAALDNFIRDEIKKRADAKFNKNIILRNGLQSYAMSGPFNAFTDNLSEADLKALKADELVARIKGLNTWNHKIFYYGPESMEKALAEVNTVHRAPAQLTPVPSRYPYSYLNQKKNQVYFVNYDMVQAEIMWVSNTGKFRPGEIPMIRMFNEYYGGGMGSVVFQTIRESKALAYSTWSAFTIPARPEVPHLSLAYVGTQADKLHESMQAMMEIMKTMPKSDNLFESAKASLKGQLETQRISREDIFFNYEQARRRGLDHDISRDIYEKIGDFTLADLDNFHKKNFADRKFSVLILGSRDKIDLKSLKKYGKVTELSLEQVFGY